MGHEDELNDKLFRIYGCDLGGWDTDTPCAPVQTDRNRLKSANGSDDAGADAVPVSEHFMLRAVAHYSAKRAPQLSFPKGASLMASSAKHRATVRNVVKRTRMSVDVSDIDLAFSILTANVPATGKKRGDMLRERGITADEVKYIKSRLPLQL